MATPACPPGWTCTFVPQKVPFDGPWWEGTWGIVAGLAAIVCLAIISVWIAYSISENRLKRADIREREQKRQHELDIEEQWTMQIDAAQGNTEMLKMIQNQRNIRSSR